MELSDKQKQRSRTIALLANRVARRLAGADGAEAESLRDALLVLNHAQSAVQIHEKEATKLYAAAKRLANKVRDEDE